MVSAPWPGSGSATFLVPLQVLVLVPPATLTFSYLQGTLQVWHRPFFFLNQLSMIVRVSFGCFVLREAVTCSGWILPLTRVPADSGLRHPSEALRQVARRSTK